MSRKIVEECPECGHAETWHSMFGCTKCDCGLGDDEVRDLDNRPDLQVAEGGEGSE